MGYRKAFAIIGANWGDEGKGLGTDALAHRLSEDGTPVTVVRSNGGAQAGHGVERPGHVRHVFHHIGAGSFAGAATHLSQFFVAHPMLLARELKDLEGIGITPRRITIDPRAPVTTPWDMAVNQMLERSRGTFRHGSTGLGFGETIERQERGPSLTAADLWGDDLRDRLTVIRDNWAPERLDELGIENNEGGFRALFHPKHGILERFLEDIAVLRANVSLMPDAELGDELVLFEGAQGLQLDMDYGEMPHVTRSHTGLRNMVTIAQEAGIDHIAPLYMTRAYATRHGAGPLPHEAHDEEGFVLPLKWAEVVDETNAPNIWQGHIRQAKLDIDRLKEVIDKDLTAAQERGIRISAALGVTCLDQIIGGPRASGDDPGNPKVRGVLRTRGFDLVPEASVLAFSIANHVGLKVGLTSWGPTRESVHWTQYADLALRAPRREEASPEP